MFVKYSPGHWLNFDMRTVEELFFFKLNW